MCRYNQLWGCALVTFGFGVLVGIWLEGGFWCHCFGIGLIALGCGILRRK